MSVEASVLVAGLAVVLASGQDASTRVSERAALSWLAIVDAGDYEESWHQASELFRQDMARFGKDVSFWAKSLGVSRTPLGKVRSREAVHVESKSGARAALVEITFASAFEGADHVTETIVMMLEDDGEWRMATYLIARPRPGEYGHEVRVLR